MKAAIAALISRWLLWQQASTNRRIFSAALTVGVMTVAVKLVAMAKDVVVAAQFGPGDLLDAFLIAFLVPTFLINLIGGAFPAAFVPAYIRLREDAGRDAASRLFQSTMLCALVLLGAVSLVAGVTAGHYLPLLGSGFSPEKLALTKMLLYLLLPAILVNGLAVCWAATLNAHERFGLAALAPVMVPLAAVCALAAFGSRWGIYALAVGTAAGLILELVVLGSALMQTGMPLLPRWRGATPELVQVQRQYLPMLAGALLMGSTVLVDQAMAAMLEPGSVSALSFGNKLVSLVLGLSATALGTSVLPFFSRQVAARDWPAVRHTLRTYSKLIVLTTVPLTALVLVSSDVVIAWLFQRGRFSPEDSALVAQVQRMYALQIPSYVLGILMVRLVSALKQNQLLMIISGVNLGLNVLLNWILMRVLGVSGIALSTSIVYLVSTVLVFLALDRHLRTLSPA